MSARVYITRVNPVVDAIVATSALDRQVTAHDIEAYDLLVKARNALGRYDSETGSYSHEISDKALDFLKKAITCHPVDKVFGQHPNLRHFTTVQLSNRDDAASGATSSKESIMELLSFLGLNSKASVAIQMIEWD